MFKRILLAIGSLFIITQPALGQEIEFQESFYRAKILGVVNEKEVEQEFFDEIQKIQTLEVRLISGEEKGKKLEMEYVFPVASDELKSLSKGDEVVVIKTSIDGEFEYEVFEPYRLSALTWLTILFILIAVAVAGIRGLTSLLGLAASLLVLIGWMIPQIVSGANPFMVSVVGVVVIAGFSFYLSHGIKWRTTLAVISTLITLFLSILMAVFSVSFAQLFGLGSEEAASLGITLADGIDLRGLLLGAIVIGALGVLDDITTAQVAIVEELKKANAKFSWKDLYWRSMSVGRTHIVSLINTLVIAYVGASFPVFLLFSVSTQPFWVILNNEFLAEEVVRTLVGSATLILSVPITTLIAAYFYDRNPKYLPKEKGNTCGHVH